jgi:cyclic pyranopterin phosphate synthase
MKELTHIDNKGNIKMVDITEKKESFRVAKCSGKIYAQEETIDLIKKDKIEKGNVFTTAKIAGIMSAKNTSQIIPLTHPIKIDFIDIEFDINKNYIEVISTVKTTDKTGVEMEAFVAVNVALLTIYDMCKGVDRRMEISGIKLIEKTGGKTNFYRNKVLSVNISEKKGTVKKPVEFVNVIQNFGIENDAHSSKDSNRQISLLSTISINKIKEKGINVDFGAFGENLTIKDIPIYKAPIGTKIYFENGVIIEITQIGKECVEGCAISKETGFCVMPYEGVFAKVLKGGIIRKGEDIIIEWT